MNTPHDTSTEKQPIEPIKAPALPFEMKANLIEYRRRLGVARFVLALGLTFVFYAKFGFVVWILSVIGLAAVIMLILFFLARRKVIATTTDVTFVNGIGMKRTVPYAQIADSRVFLSYIEPGFGVVVRVIIGTSHKKPLVSLTSLFWKLEDVDLLIAALTSKGATFEYYEDMVQSAAIAKQFPESVAAYEKHPYLIATGIVIAILAVVVAAVLLFM